MACAARVAEVWPDDNDGAIANQLRVLFAVERSPPPDTCGMRVAEYRAAHRGLSVRRLLPRVARSHSLSPRVSPHRDSAYVANATSVCDLRHSAVLPQLRQLDPPHTIAGNGAPPD